MAGRSTWKQVPSARAKREMATQAMRPWGCGLPCLAAQPMRTRPAGSSLTALTQIGAVCGASSCAKFKIGSAPLFCLCQKRCNLTVLELQSARSSTVPLHLYVLMAM